jgi:hypothetical protein
MDSIGNQTMIAVLLCLWIMMRQIDSHMPVYLRGVWNRPILWFYGGFVPSLFWNRCKLIPISYLLIGAPVRVYSSWHMLRLPHTYFVGKIARHHRVISLYGLYRRGAGTHSYQYGRTLLVAGSDSP